MEIEEKNARSRREEEEEEERREVKGSSFPHFAPKDLSEKGKEKKYDGILLSLNRRVNFRTPHARAC